MMKKCKVCEQTESKYRCPACRILYCSVGCYKTHKDNLCMKFREELDIVPASSEKKVDHLSHGLELCEVMKNASDEEDKVSPEKLSLLESSKIIKDMLTNVHLRKILRNIDAHEDHGKELEAAMKLPMFVEFANECLKIVDADG